MFTKLSNLQKFINKENDRLHPNLYSNFQKERYVEKKIISLIEKEDITEIEYHTLCLLTQLNK